MNLSKFIIINNKSCKKIAIEFSTEKPEVLIGINDCGKSTILKSLKVFFDEKESLSFLNEKQQKNDLSNSPLNPEEFNEVFLEHNYPIFSSYSKDLICILCEFKIEDGDFSEDFLASAKNNHLKHAIGESKKVVMMRVFHNLEGNNNLSGYYLLTKDYKDDEGKYLCAWEKNKTDIKKIREKYNITDDDVQNENSAGPFRNIEEIKAIYKKLENNLEDVWLPYKDFSKDKTCLPSFKYLDWNFSLKDLEELAGEAMTKVIEPLLKEITDVATAKQGEAIEKVNTEFEEMMAGLKCELPNTIKKISSAVHFGVTKKITDITLQKNGSDGEIHIENQGDGIKRQIWFAILKWQSKMITGETRKKHIWCFDEPETHLYPSAQRQLFTTFRDMCAGEFQILLSTHSTVFIDRTQIQNINEVVVDNGYSFIKKTNNVDDVFNALGLQNSDFLFFDKFIAIEGQTDYELIPHLYKLKYGRSLVEDGIQIINLKGQAQYENNKDILEKILLDFTKPKDKVFYLFDNDTGKTGYNIFTVGTYDLEDAISNEIWIKFVKLTTEINITSSTIDTEVRAKMQNSQSHKFYDLLRAYITINNSGIYLPNKGVESGSYLARVFLNVSEIPLNINILFEALNS